MEGVKFSSLFYWAEPVPDTGGYGAPAGEDDFQRMMEAILGNELNFLHEEWYDERGYLHYEGSHFVSTEVGGVMSYFKTFEAAQSAREEWSSIESGARIADTSLFVGWWGFTGATSTLPYWGRMLEEQGEAVIAASRWQGLYGVES